jgi:iron complex outermembrane receptor protein
MTSLTPGFRLVKGRALATTSAIALIAGTFAGPQQAAAADAPAQNAQAPAAVEEIVVTGSRVIRDGYEAPTPVSVLGVEELNQMADTNIADSVNKLPAFSGSTTPRSATANLTSGAAGVNILNLRGIGGNRVLVLLDGKRVINASVSNGFTGADINSMPNGLISRVDVVTGGASAAYGSDALSGVVNFVLDKEFVGIKGKVEGGVTTYGDDRNFTVSLSGGTAFAGGKGHFLIFGEDGFNDGIIGVPRGWNAGGGSVIANSNYTPTNGQPAFLAARQIGVSNGTAGGLITSGPLKGIYFGPGGVPAQFNYGSICCANNAMSGGDWQMSRIDNGLDLDPEVERLNMFTRVSYDVTDNIQVHGEFQWAYAHSNANSNPNRTLANMTILSGNPFIPASVQAQMTALKLTSFVMGSWNGDVPRFHSNNRRTTRRGEFGMNGNFDALDTNWKWDAYYQISKNGLSERADSVGNNPRILLGRDAVRNPTTGAIVCRSTLTNPTNGCVPYNPFGIGVNSKAAVDYYTGTSYRYDSLRQDASSVSVSGEPFSSWAGPVSLAFGIEHRYERITSVQTADDEAGNWLTGNYRGNYGNYSVTEGFAEAVVPLAKDVAWAQTFDLNLAVRGTDYTTSGYVTTWKVGATYQPMDDLRFRFTRSRDIRAANLGELFAGGTAASGNPFSDPFTNTQITGGFQLSRGNPILKPEEADTTGLGVVLSPSFFPGFQASVDYWNIDISGSVTVPSGQSIIDGCFAGNTILCPNIIRVNGAIQTVVVSPQNIASQVARGIDIETSYRVNLDEVVDSWKGGLSIRALASYVLRMRSVDTTLSANQVVEGAGVLGGFATVGYTGQTAPKMKLNASVTYTNDPMSVTVGMRHTAGGTYNNAFVQCTSGCPNNGGRTIDNNRVDADTVYDLNLTYKPFEENQGTEVFLTVQNVFNTDPPFVGGNTGSTYYSGQSNTRYDVLGRNFLAGVRFKM